MRVPDGAVTKALTLPSPVEVTGVASTTNSVVDSRKTPAANTRSGRVVTSIVDHFTQLVHVSLHLHLLHQYIDTEHRDIYSVAV